MKITFLFLFPFLFLFLFLFLIININSQVLLKYPEKQNFYNGGINQFYRDAHDFLISNNISPCENKNEAFLMKFIVYEDNQVKIVKEFDESAIENNKCAADIGKKILANIDGFIPAQINNSPKAAIARVLIYPGDLFSLYYSTYHPAEIDYTEVNFPGGIKNYRAKFISCFNVDAFRYNQDIGFKVMFEINTQGEVQNIFTEPYIENSAFLKMIENCIIPHKKFKFIPTKYKVTPIVSFFTFSVSVKNY